MSKICLVTGASRGIGRGIALQLCEQGHTVYITGRTLQPVTSGGEKAQKFSALQSTADDASARGGKCIPVACDHSDDGQVEALFKRIAREQNNKLDLLVNNAYAAAEVGLAGIGKNFWDKDAAGDWDATFTVVMHLRQKIAFKFSYQIRLAFVATTYVLCTQQNSWFRRAAVLS